MMTALDHFTCCATLGAEYKERLHAALLSSKATERKCGPADGRSLDGHARSDETKVQ